MLLYVIWETWKYICIFYCFWVLRRHTIKILPRGRHVPIYLVWSIPWLLMPWRHKEPGHQQPWYWPHKINGYSSSSRGVARASAAMVLTLFWNIPVSTLGGLTHWGRVTHICVGNLTTIGSDNGLSPGRCQAIIWTNAEILLIGPLGTNFSEILIEFKHFHWRKCVWKCRLRNVVNFVSASMC